MSGAHGTAQDERLNELEIRLTFMEQLLGDLNDALTAESARVSLLERQLDALRQRQDPNADAAAADPRSEPPPPHY